MRANRLSAESREFLGIAFMIHKIRLVKKRSPKACLMELGVWHLENIRFWPRQAPATLNVKSISTVKTKTLCVLCVS